MLSVAPRVQLNAPVLVAPAACPSYSTLPPDVLRLIFKHIALHPLLSSVSVVCKRWRRCALESVTKFRASGGPHPGALVILPSITELVVCSPVQVVPTSLRRLRLHPNEANGEVFRPFAAAQHLQLESLSYSSSAVWDIARNSRTSLTHLATIYADGDIGPLPALVSLELTHSSSPCPSLLTGHASQLTSLRVNLMLPWLADLALPRLAHVAVSVFAPTDADQLEALVRRTPSLTSLSISTDSVFPALDRLAPLVTELELSFYDKEESFGALSNLRFQRMRSLIVRSERLDGLEQLIARNSNTLEKVMVVVRSYKYNMRWVEALAKCKSLTSLRLNYNPACFYKNFLAGLRMPALRTLALSSSLTPISSKVIAALRVRV